ncbi:uncharacterized protein LOC142483504 [Ascaphus truei]|uniref:uncharacterized protein LOC142483504 n=1 Tax=Ascaphus truei TaxID=8439 RepID=UPI003F5967E1
MLKLWILVNLGFLACMAQPSQVPYCSSPDLLVPLITDGINTIKSLIGPQKGDALSVGAITNIVTKTVNIKTLTITPKPGVALDLEIELEVTLGSDQVADIKVIVKVHAAIKVGIKTGCLILIMENPDDIAVTITISGLGLLDSISGALTKLLNGVFQKTLYSVLQQVVTVVNVNLSAILVNLPIGENGLISYSVLSVDLTTTINLLLELVLTVAGTVLDTSCPKIPSLPLNVGQLLNYRVPDCLLNSVLRIVKIPTSILDLSTLKLIEIFPGLLDVAVGDVLKVEINAKNPVIKTIAGSASVTITLNVVISSESDTLIELDVTVDLVATHNIIGGNLELELCLNSEIEVEITVVTTHQQCGCANAATEVKQTVIDLLNLYLNVCLKVPTIPLPVPIPVPIPTTPIPPCQQVEASCSCAIPK